MKTSSTGGATDSLHLCKQDLETDPSWCWAVQGRLKILSSNLTPADLFSSLGKLKKKNRGRGREVPLEMVMWAANMHCIHAAVQPGAVAPGLPLERCLVTSVCTRSVVGQRRAQR